jgi:hypothetical protein
MMGEYNVLGRPLNLLHGDILSRTAVANVVGNRGREQGRLLAYQADVAGRFFLGKVS